WMSSGSHTTRSLRARIAFDLGPGISPDTFTTPTIASSEGCSGRLPARGSESVPSRGDGTLPRVRGLGGLLGTLLGHRSHLGGKGGREVRRRAQRLLLQQERARSRDGH